MAIKVTEGVNQALYCCLIVDCTLVTVLLRGATFAPRLESYPYWHPAAIGSLKKD